MKRVLSILVAALLILSLAACSAGQQSTGGTAKNVVILSASDGEESNKIIVPYLPEIEQKTGIKVSFTEMDMEALHTKLSTLFAANSSEVDAAWTYVAWTAEFANAGYLEDITNKLTKDEWDKYVTAALDTVSYKNKIYGIPKFFSLRSFYYNQVLFEKAGIKNPPKTWDELVAAAKATTNAANNEYGLLCGLGSNGNFSIAFQDMLVLTGGLITDNNDKVTFNNDAGVQALEKLVELSKLGVIDPASYGINSGDVKRERWIKGQDAMTWEWAATYKVSNDQAISKIVGKCVPALVPAIKTSGAVTGSEGYVIPKFSKNKDAALKILKQIAAPDVQKRMVLKTGWYPVVKSVFEDKEVLASSPIFKVAGDQSKFPTMRFAAPYTSELEATLGPEILSALQGKKTPKQALDDAAKATEGIIARSK